MSEIQLTLKIWRQTDPDSPGRLQTYASGPISTDMSFLEMLDVLNERLTLEGQEPVAFDHDCREGICGICGAVVNGHPHGPEKETTLCQLHMRHFKDGDEIWIEPWRAKAFPVLKDLIADRTAFEKIIRAGGYISVNTGSAPDANAIPIRKEDADASFEAAACIGCGACVAACKNASAMLFVAAKVVQFAKLPQGQPERRDRALAMVEEMDRQGFGNCTNYLECEAVCPKSIPAEFITQLNREYLTAAVTSERYL